MNGVDVHLGRDTERENSKIRDNNRRQLCADYELRRRLYKAVANDTTVPPEVREESKMKLSRLPRNCSLTRLRSRCVFTGRGRGVVTLFRMSRIVFRDLARRGALPGVQKASW